MFSKKTCPVIIHLTGLIYKLSKPSSKTTNLICKTTNTTRCRIYIIAYKFYKLIENATGCIIEKAMLVTLPF
jgi:hypothetical protein